MNEGAHRDKKSIRFLQEERPDWRELAKDAVCFANAYGGHIHIGLEDDQDDPAPAQRIPPEWPAMVRRRIMENSSNVVVETQVITAPNGGEYLDVVVQRSTGTPASTWNKRFYMRVGDECRPIGGDDLLHLMTDKAAFIWELQPTQVPAHDADPKKRAAFIQGIRSSERVTAHVKGMAADELLEHYQLAHGGRLTHLGVLWLGTQAQRARLPNAPVVYFIKYDEAENKVAKISWDDHARNPQELLDAIWREVPDWREGIEVGDGIFRRTIPHYEEVVVRELVANALVHRPYTTSGAIFINLYPDRLEIHNPGLLPLGVTPVNILHQSKPRNEKLAKVFHDLLLMEREGSGYDRVYASLLTQGKGLPLVVEGDDRVTVTVRRHIRNDKVAVFLVRLLEGYQDLKRREVICLGLIAQHNGLRLSELQRELGLKTPELAQSWLGGLRTKGIVRSKGRRPDLTLVVEPKILRQFEFGGRTDLKQIEKPRLKELVRADLELHRASTMDEIHDRVGREIPLRRLRAAMNALRTEGAVCSIGATRATRYFLCEHDPHVK